MTGVSLSGPRGRSGSGISLSTSPVVGAPGNGCAVPSHPGSWRHTPRPGVGPTCRRPPGHSRRCLRPQLPGSLDGRGGVRWVLHCRKGAGVRAGSCPPVHEWFRKYKCAVDIVSTRSYVRTPRRDALVSTDTRVEPWSYGTSHPIPVQGEGGVRRPVPTVPVPEWRTSGGPVSRPGSGGDLLSSRGPHRPRVSPPTH